MPITTAFNHTADLDKGAANVLLRQPLSTLDANAHVFVVEARRGSEPANLTGARCEGWFVRADGVTVPIDGEIVENTAIVTLLPACYEVPGRFALAVKLALGDVIHTILRAEGSIDVSRTDALTEGGTGVQSFDEIVASLDAIFSAAESAGADAQRAEDAADRAEAAAERAEQIGGSSGTPDMSDELLGQTPYTTAHAGAIKLMCDTECAYTIRSNTVAIADIMSATLSHATLKEVDGRYQLQCTGDTTGWFQSYAEMYISGLTVGTKYNFVHDASGVTNDYNTDITVGHWILYDSAGQTLLTRINTHGAIKQVQEFTASTDTVRIVWYPAGNYTYSAGEKGIANVNAIYINRAGTSDLSAIIDISGNFSGVKLLNNIPAGVVISSEPPCEVYAPAEAASSGTISRHAGKTCVCFGDSVTGNMTAPNDYPSILAEETGMTVINAGFGGCRMSDTHPTAAYAAFSMVKLADAVASGNWTLQDANVSGLSVATNGVEHLAALKTVDWSKVDFVTIAYGTNDVQGAVGIDNAGNPQDTKKYLGALRYAITKLLTAYPHIKLMLLTPIYRYWNEENVDSDSKMFNGGTQHFTEWGDGLLKVAEEYKIPAVDMYRTLGFNAITRAYYFPSTDGTHPNVKGLELIGQKIAARLLSEY